MRDFLHVFKSAGFASAAAPASCLRPGGAAEVIPNLSRPRLPTPAEHRSPYNHTTALRSHDRFPPERRSWNPGAQAGERWPSFCTRRLVLTAPCHRPEDDFGPDPEDDQIDDHLPCD